MGRQGYSLITGVLMIVMLIGISQSQSMAGDPAIALSNVPSQWRSDVANVLELASLEWNDGELLAALETYPPGTPKHRAVCFLIANMDKHLYVDYVNQDDPLNPFSPEDGEIDWIREYIWDYSTMTSELLIENVEWAFLARESFPWCRSLSEEVFFEYVLPYRSTQEPIHSWRPQLFEEHAPTVTGLSTSLEVAALINRHNTEVFGFDPLYYRHPEDRDIPTLLAGGLGRCEDMSNLSNYSLRAVGVPTTSDFTPRWPKGDNNHAWNAVWFEGEWYTFMGCEGGPEPVWNSIRDREFAKVYRKSFSADPIMDDAPDGTSPPRLMRVAALDVTREYTTVSDVMVDVYNPARAIYLCVFNYYTWRAVAGAWAEDARVEFTDVGNMDILYCATRYVEDETGWGDHYPVAAPFVLHLDGSLEFIQPCYLAEATGEISVSGWNSGSALEDGQEVTLFRYQGCDDPEADNLMEWKLMGTVEAVTEDEVITATFPDSAIEGGLYILSDSQDTESFREGSRPFVWSQDGIVYY